MKRMKKYLTLLLALVLCLSMAACGSDGADEDNLYDVPDSFEGLVKDSEQMSNLYVYGGAWRGEDGSTMIVAAIGTFTKLTGDAPGENIGDGDYGFLAGVWYQDGEPGAASIIEFDATGSWTLSERPGGDGDPAVVDSGTIEVDPDGAGTYFAVSDMYEDVVYDMTLVGDDVIYWGGEYDYYQKMA